MTTRSRSRSTRWPLAASATSRSSRTAARPASSRRGMSSAISRRASTERDHVAMTRVLVLADDLIWSTRLIDQVRAAGADGAPIRTLAALNQALPAADAVVVDLTARAYDGIVAVRRAADAGRRVLAVGQHDDAALRKRA